jgi:hypothetical protein
VYCQKDHAGETTSHTATPPGGYVPALKADDRTTKNPKSIAKAMILHGFSGLVIDRLSRTACRRPFLGQLRPSVPAKFGARDVNWGPGGRAVYKLDLEQIPAVPGLPASCEVRRRLMH